jgi:glycosyltransferase involved in cell wall biosynthesis
VAVVIPCYRVSRKIAGVLREIGPEVDLIYCVDDACPENSGAVAQAAAAADPRFHLLRHAVNQGVGGAMVSGYRQAIEDGADVIVKLDGDGQMDPAKIPALIAPIVHGAADYVKANRFFSLESLKGMPPIRLVGNAGLSFLSKLSGGYWNLFDPTNGYTAIHAAAAAAIPLEKLSRRYFFESDILFRLATVRAVVVEVPMPARYADEHSSLSPFRALVEFPFYHARNLFKRLFYNYLLRDFNIASLNLALGMPLLVFGAVFGALAWIHGAYYGPAATSGTVMLAALPVILGFQSVLSFFHFDMANVPKQPIHPGLRQTLPPAAQAAFPTAGHLATVIPEERRSSKAA